MLHGRLLRVSELVVVLGAALEQQRSADVQQQLHHAESAASAAETRAAQLEARQNEARAIALNTINRLASEGQASGSKPSDSGSWRTASLRMLTREEK